MKLFANLFQISSTKKDTYPGDVSGDSIIATGEASADKAETAQVYGQHGFISNPAPGTKGVRIRIGSIDIIIAAYSYKVPVPNDPGATKVYSTDAGGNEASTLNLLPDGTIEINGDADNAVSFQDLKTALDNLKASIDTATAGSITGHTHVETGGTTAPGVGAAPPVTVDITAAKVDEVKLP